MKSQKLLAISLFLVPVFAQAQAASAVTVADPNTLLGARSQGRAGATGASNLTHDSLFQNPASAAFIKSYAVSAGYVGAGDSLTASVVDTQSGPVGGGIYYLRRDLRKLDSATITSNPALGNYARSEEHAGVALLGRPSQQVGVGIIGRYIYRRSYDSRVANKKGWNGDAGLRYMANQELSIGVTAQNLLTDETGVAPRRFAAAVEYTPMIELAMSAQVFKVQPESLPANFTLPNPEQTTGFALGAEYRWPNGAMARAGYSSNPAWNQKIFSLGGGWENKSVSVDYALQKGIGSSLITHSILVTGYF
jgi:hypothetical protein